ncbi:MAG: XrtA/PEP-CTERM system-associated ATPase [Pseudomonadota bacterium]
MYEEYFNFSGQPFKLNPDPKFFYGSQSHNKAMAYLHYGLRQSEGFIVITGEIGAGKSMLISHLLDQIDRSNVIAADLITPNLKREDLLAHILSAYRIEPAGTGPTAEIEAFEDYLFDQMNRGRRVLLIVDEAQNLPADTLEELRVLSNLDYDGTPLFQVFLVGQPEFKRIIGGDGMEQLRQRIIASYHLESLDSTETRAYIEHRLRVVGWTDRPLVSEEAYALVHEAARGIPRNINKLFNRLLFFCALEKCDTISGDIVRTVIEDLAAEDVSGNPMILGEKNDADDGLVDTEKPIGDSTERIEAEVQSSELSQTESVTVQDGQETLSASKVALDDDVHNPQKDNISKRVETLPPPVVVNGAASDDLNDEYAENAIDDNTSTDGPVLRLVSDNDDDALGQNSDTLTATDDGLLSDPFELAGPFELADDVTEEPLNEQTALVTDPEIDAEITSEDSSSMLNEESVSVGDKQMRAIPTNNDSNSTPVIAQSRDHKTGASNDDADTIEESNGASVVGPDLSDANTTGPSTVPSQAPMSVLDRLRANKQQPYVNARSDKPSDDGAAKAAREVSQATINDVAEAIAKASSETATSIPSGNAALVTDADRHVEDDPIAQEAAIDEAIIGAFVDAPLETIDSDQHRVSVERWRVALARTAASTRQDLTEAQTLADRLRERLGEYSSREQETRKKVTASLSRAEAVLAELRDSWK